MEYSELPPSVRISGSIRPDFFEEEAGTTGEEVHHPPQRIPPSVVIAYGNGRSRDNSTTNLIFGPSTESALAPAGGKRGNRAIVLIIALFTIAAAVALVIVVVKNLSLEEENVRLQDIADSDEAAAGEYKQNSHTVFIDGGTTDSTEGKHDDKKHHHSSTPATTTVTTPSADVSTKGPDIPATTTMKTPTTAPPPSAGGSTQSTTAPAPTSGGGSGVPSTISPAPSTGGSTPSATAPAPPQSTENPDIILTTKPVDVQNVTSAILINTKNPVAFLNEKKFETESYNCDKECKKDRRLVGFECTLVTPKGTFYGYGVSKRNGKRNVAAAAALVLYNVRFQRDQTDEAISADNSVKSFCETQSRR